MNDDIQFITKQEVCKLLGVGERTLERFIYEDCIFPPGLARGKHKAWVASVVHQWIRNSAAAQMNWEPPKRRKAKKKRESTPAREINPAPSA